MTFFTLLWRNSASGNPDKNVMNELCAGILTANYCDYQADVRTRKNVESCLNKAEKQYKLILKINVLVGLL